MQEHQQVFVDATGRRKRVVISLGLLTAASCALCLVLIVYSVSTASPTFARWTGTGDAAVANRNISATTSTLATGQNPPATKRTTTTTLRATTTTTAPPPARPTPTTAAPPTAAPAPTSTLPPTTTTLATTSTTRPLPSTSTTIPKS